MKYIFKVQPSKTEQTIEVNLPDLPANVTPIVTGTTPIDGTTPPPPPTTGYQTTYISGFDKESDIINDHNQHGNGGLSTSVFKTGPGSFKAVPKSVSGGFRSEIQYDYSDTPFEGAIEYDVMYENLFTGSGHSLQFHPKTSGGSASPGLWHENGKFTWVNWKGGANTKYPTGYTIPKNKWIHIRLEYKMGSSGYLRFWVDGSLLVDKNNIQVGDNSGAYLKVGTNQWSQAPSTVYYDNLIIQKKV